MIQHFDIKVYGTGTIGQKGQIVVPAKARKELGIKPNDEFMFFGHGKMIHLVRASELDSILDHMTKKFTERLSALKQIKKKI
jgi:AbrB family looped-hinge helix DNA binding protein